MKYPLSLPEPDDGFGHADIIGLKRVQGDTCRNGCSAEGPRGGGAGFGDAGLGEVVDDARPRRALAPMFGLVWVGMLWLQLS